MPTVNLHWVDGAQFVGTDASGQSVVLSGSSKQGGASPSQMLLIALGTCSAVDVVGILGKKRMPPTQFEVIVNGEQNPDPPWAYHTIHMTYKLTGKNLTEKAVSQAISLSQDKYCSVAATIRGVAQIHTHFEIVQKP